MRRSNLQTFWGTRWRGPLAGDAAVLGILLGTGLIAFTSIGTAGGKASVAEVSVRGRNAISVSTADEGIHQVEGRFGPTRIEFRGGRARVLSSSCPLKLCQRAGWIGAAGEMLACVPNEVVVRFAGKADETVDAVSR